LDNLSRLPADHAGKALLRLAYYHPKCVDRRRFVKFPRNYLALLTSAFALNIMYLYDKYNKEQRRGVVEIIISSNTSKPIYEQITSQIKAMIMSGELKTGDPIPSMRALAKSIHVSVITVQKAYEDLQRDGFIETTVGRGSFVSAQNKDFYQEEQQRLAEEHLQEAADIGRTSGISLEKLIELLTMFYQEED